MSLVTGSHAYGKVHDKSDIDLVIRISKADFERLKQVGDWFEGRYGEAPCQSIRFGKLNVLCCLTDKSYETWQIGTRELKKKRPVERKEAVMLFRQLRKERGS